MKDKSSLVVKYTAKLIKQRKSAPLKVKVAFREAVVLFLEDPDNPQLRNHLLREKYSGFRSINVTDDYRAIFRIKKEKYQSIVTFHELDTHDELYGEN